MEDYQRLEQRWARWNDLDPDGMVACSSGTAALLLAFQCLDLEVGSDVLVPDYTMVACARAVVESIHVPVFLDCSPVVLTLDPDEVEAEVSSSTTTPRGVLAVHVYGRRCNMGRLAKLCRKHGMKLVEDLAEAHGVQPHSQTDAACWSFYKNKVVAGEEGGAVWFRDPKQAEHARRLRSLGFTPEHDYTHVPYGWNHRMSNAHARLVLDSLDRVDENIKSRWDQWHLYADEVPQHFQGPPPEVPWVFDAQVPRMSRDRQVEMVDILRKAGVPVRYGFKPMLMQEEFSCPNAPPTDHPVSLAAWTEVVYVNLPPGKPLETVALWADLLAKVCGYSAK